MDKEKKRIGVFIESDFYENEIFYYQLRFPEEDIEVTFYSRLWGQDALTFKGHEYGAPFYCSNDFESLTESEIDSFSAFIVPAGMVSDRLRYTEDTGKIPPASLFLKKLFQKKHIIKGIICHGLWLASPVSEVVRGRKMVAHNNLIGDVKNYGAVYVDQDLVVDDDLITARTGGHCNLLARAIIQRIK
ncbi:DJ-1/PfpI family protein [Balneolaceae bacterium ANBcel3]|nr:DJ-1/PfpI family protein [Balneolaceae bacterium ANBcel3]